MKSLLALVYQFVLRYDRLDHVGLRRVMQLLNDRFMAVTIELHPSRRTCPSTNALLCTFMRYFSRTPCASRNMVPHPYRLPIAAAKLHVFLLFCTGCHDLRIARGRFSGVLKSKRFCVSCPTALVCDERHLVCPALQHVRHRFSHLFTGDMPTMASSFWQKNMRNVIYFVLEFLAVLAL